MCGTENSKLSVPKGKTYLTASDSQTASDIHQQPKISALKYLLAVSNQVLIAIVDLKNNCSDQILCYLFSSVHS